jgi:hypothetical protein
MLLKEVLIWRIELRVRLRVILIQQIDRSGSVLVAIPIRWNRTTNKLLEVISIGSFACAERVSRSFAVYFALLNTPHCVNPSIPIERTRSFLRLLRRRLHRGTP